MSKTTTPKRPRRPHLTKDQQIAALRAEVARLQAEIEHLKRPIPQPDGTFVDPRTGSKWGPLMRRSDRSELELETRDQWTEGSRL